VRVALVHDYLNQYGGAERVLEALHELYPDAPVYTSIYEPDAMPDHFRTWDIRTSFLQRMPLARRFHRAFLLLYPPAFESFDLHFFDVVISNSSSWAKSVITPPETLHICYCLTPMRFAWNYKDYLARENLGKPIRRLLPVAIHYLRMWDAVTASRADKYIGISRAVVGRIAKYYGRDADLIPPPVDTQSISMGSGVGENYLVVSRLIPYKKIDLAVVACSRLGLPLTVVGSGRDRARLELLAGPTVKFVGRVSDGEVQAALASCRAFLFPGEEDFGIAPVEAMAAGRPVVAYAAGGALDTVVDGITGRLFSPQTEDALADRLASFDPKDFDPRTMREHALRYDTRSFQEAIGEYVERAWDEKISAPVARWERTPV
jgi:glycosyltransferase involved in cell wall biosynthesis